MYEVRADIKRIDSYSGHGDYEEMIGFLNCQDKSKLSQVILVHGEYESQDHYRTKLNEEGYNNIIIPALAEEIEV